MYNFNHERFGLAVQATRFARVCYEEAFRYLYKIIYILNFNPQIYDL